MFRAENIQARLRERPLRPLRPIVTDGPRYHIHYRTSSWSGRET